MGNPFEAGSIPAQEKPEVSPSTEKLPDFGSLKADEQKRIIIESLDKVDTFDGSSFSPWHVSQFLEKTYSLKPEDYAFSRQICSELENEGKLKRNPGGRDVTYQIAEK
jgi:hypothetical protein